MKAPMEYPQILQQVTRLLGMASLAMPGRFGSWLAIGLDRW